MPLQAILNLVQQTCQSQYEPFSLFLTCCVQGVESGGMAEISIPIKRKQKTRLIRLRIVPAPVHLY